MSGISSKWLLTLSVLLILTFASPAIATERFSQLTKKNCAHCHRDPAGGGELTPAGEHYLEFLSADQKSESGPPDRSPGHRLFRLIVGYIHILTGILWFGTILYVHTILKPVYASSGLPGGEVRVGLASMLIMGVTGSILTFYKVPSFSFLYSTRFGVLLSIKISLFLIMVTSALFVILVLSKRLKEKQGGDVQPVQDTTMGLEELKQFDGKEGRPAYIAYQGEIYDVSESPLWKEGRHMGRHQAGTDLTAYLAQAPHGEEKIFERTVPIGRLSTQETVTARSQPLRVFYFMAYMNLTIVLLITVILALWRWGW